MDSIPPSKVVVNYISTSNPKPPFWNTVNNMKASRSLRRQYSVETIDHEILSLLASKLGRRLISNGGEKITRVYSGDSLGQLVDRGPLQEFTLFPQLPAELRIKIWKISVLPRIVLRHQYDTERNHGPVVLFTPCIPALLHVSQEARQIGLENYQVVNARRCNMNGNTAKRLGPIYFHPELDILLCAVWDGQHLSPVVPEAFPQRILKQARHLAVTQSDFQEIISGMDRTDRMNTIYNKLRRCYEKLETVSFLYNFRETLHQGPWKLKFECVRDMMAQTPTVSTSGYKVYMRWLTFHLKDIELAYPDWKVPRLKQMVIQCTEAFAKK